MANKNACGNALTGTTGTGTYVGATSPTLVTPLLGTVTSGNISACTSTSMVMVTPVLGTPTSGTLTNCTGLPVAGGGTGVASLTAYGVLCGGTTTTGAVQALAALGTTGATLTSAGAGALPSFKGGNTAFLATLSNTQTISSSTATTVLLDTLIHGTGSMMDVTTNKGRFTPTVAGKYLIVGTVVYSQSFLAANFINMVILKNGSTPIFQAIPCVNSAATYNYNIAATIVSLNGSTDYITLTTYHDNASSRTIYGDGASCTMSGCLLEAS